MGDNSKGKRKLVYSGVTYYWNVQQDAEDYGRINLNIVSEDKKFIVSYHVAQTNHDKTPHIVVKGIKFGGLDNHYRQGWVRVQTPIWNDRIVTPGLVRTVIEWCLFQKNQLTFVDWEGNLI